MMPWVQPFSHELYHVHWPNIWACCVRILEPSWHVTNKREPILSPPPHLGPPWTVALNSNGETRPEVKTQVLKSTSALALQLPLRKAILCHSPRRTSLGEQHDSQIPQELLHAAYRQVLFFFCGKAPAAYPRLLQVARGLNSWSSFRKCYSMPSSTSKNCTKAHPILAQFWEALKAAWEHTPSSHSLLKLHENKFWWMLACHPKHSGVSPLTHVLQVGHHCSKTFSNSDSLACSKQWTEWKPASCGCATLGDLNEQQIAERFTP